MIVAEKKPIEEIIELVKAHKKILVAGCNECVTMNEAKEVRIDEITLERQCDHEYLEELRNTIDQYDAVISLACGVGVQFTAEKYFSTPVYPGVNTCFMGATEERGVWGERCQGCGQCVLGKTAGICPVSRCAKRVLNGPCGGSTNGFCEIDKETVCAWQLIVERLKALNRLDEYEQLAPIKDWSTDRAGGPRKVVREDVRQ